jgi:septal ring factor EnvC (AmiA/AmiB activator)
MDTNIKATLLACLFTLILSVGGAYGVLKIDDANMKTKIESMDITHMQRFDFITKTLEHQQESIYIFQEQVEKMTSAYASRTEDSMNRLDASMSKFGDKVEKLSNSIARLDERLKPIEQKRRVVDGS